MHCEVCKITPQKAADLLLRNDGNRALINSRVGFFEEQLRRGEMQLSHQGIAISESGRLLDGQHRLHAVVNTGISADFLVAKGLPDSVFTVIDTGKARTASDVISIEGATNATSTAGGIRLHILYFGAPGLVWTGQVTQRLCTTTAIKSEFDKDRENWSWAARVARSSFLVNVVNPAPATCLAYLATTYSDYSKGYIEDFLSRLKIGANLTECDPVLAYRSKCASGAKRNSAQSRLADYIKLLNAYTTGQSLKIFKSQQFPPMPTLVHASESIHENAEA